MTVTALGQEVASEDSGHAFVPTVPSVCTTPMAPAPTPVPYPITGATDRLDPGCEDVTIEGRRAMNTKGKVPKLHGNEPGTGGDVVSGVTGGTAVAIVGAATVMFEGAPVVTTGSAGMGNGT
ncbi:MAG: PAAR-like domain-containing protein [Myxococcota bacterium]